MTEEHAPPAKPKGFLKDPIGLLSVLVALMLVAVFVRVALTPTLHPLLGQPAPAVTLTMTNGDKVPLASLEGEQVVVLDFWASWCPPCRKGLPVIDQLAKDFSGEPVAFYAVNVGETRIAAEAFLDSEDLDMPLVLDEDGNLGNSFKVSGIPQTVIIGKDGVIHEIHVGLTMNFEKDLRATIQAGIDGTLVSDTPDGGA